ncbi:hypothetical protein L2744_04540 [Shewanella profunda]|uniref:hypothetical protein n=1 Tax=Shewanella profunda TaxID=254793 RepID=UPI00200BC0B7|nr:hypothetical protein [Shewanella profunda]MCL1088888.1 hypothetical protein [Shewanella profunda]
MPFQPQPENMPLFATCPTSAGIGDADSAFFISATLSEDEAVIAFDHHLSNLDYPLEPALAADVELSVLNCDASPLSVQLYNPTQAQSDIQTQQRSKAEQSSALGLGIWGFLRARQAFHYKGFSLLFFVLIVHVCLFSLIYLLWRPQLNPFGFTTTDSRGPKVTALKAYFIYAPAVEKAETAAPETEIKAEATSSVAPIPVPTPQIPVKPQPMLEKIMPENAVSEKVVPEKVKPDTVKPDITQSSAISEVEPAGATAKKPTNTFDATEIKPQLGAKSSPVEKGESTMATSSSMSLFTQQYFERQREQALDDLVIEQADKFTRKSNMSEMSPEMEVLFVPNADDFSGPTSLDLPIDPNRIVRKGDTCYRVVQVGTQVNPYAENLGFPFDCSGKKINQAIDDAIQSRLNKMMLKPYK